MKFINLTAAVLVLSVAVACNSTKNKEAAPATDDAAVAESINNGDNLDPNSLLPSKKQVDSVSYLVGINFGSFIKGYDFGDLDFAQIKKGMMDFIKAKGDQQDTNFVKQFKIDPNKMNDLFNDYLQKRRLYRSAVNIQKEDKFLAGFKTQEGYQTTESGLIYSITEPGDDVKATDSRDTVLVKYTGTRPDGTVFDQTTDEPISFALNQVIPGWTEGLKLIGQGGKEVLVIPSDLAYGERGNAGIEPNTPLKFEVELVKVSPYVEPAETKK